MRTARFFSAAMGTLLIAHGAIADLWTAPMPVAEINTQSDEGAPFLTYDGLTLYFSRDRPHPQWLYSATRVSPEGPFGTVQALTGINSSGSSANYSWVSPDNLRLYYYTSQHVIKISERALPDDPWLGGADVPELNALGGVANPSLTPDELTIVFTGTSVSGGLGGYDIWMGTRTDTSSPFGNFHNLTEINSSAWDFHPRLSSDALTLYFASERNGDGQLFRATRPDVYSSFGAPEHLDFFDSPGTWLEYPAISADGQSLYFTRAGGGSSYDIYVSHVVPVPGAVLLGAIGLSFAGCRLRRGRA